MLIFYNLSFKHKLFNLCGYCVPMPRITILKEATASDFACCQATHKIDFNVRVNRSDSSNIPPRVLHSTKEMRNGL